MTRTAELLRELIGTHLPGIEDAFVLKLLRFHCRDMIRAWSMACFTGYTRHKAVQLQLISGSGARAVTRKAVAGFVHADLSARSDFERRWYIERIPNSDIETLNVFVEAESTLVERAIVPEDVGLARLALAERVKDRLGDGVNSIGYRVQTLVAPTHDLVSIWSTAKRHTRMRAKDLASGNRLKRSPHCSHVLFC